MPDSFIVFCNPPSPPQETADREAAYGMGARRAATACACPPHTLAWSAAVLRQSGWRVAAVDAVAEQLNERATMARLRRLAPDALVLLVSPQTAVGDEAFVRAVRAALPAVPVLLVGRATRFLPPTLIEAASAVLAGEPEGAIGAACAALLGPEKQDGLLSPLALHLPSYDRQGRLLDLSFLPPPAWDLFPTSCYDELPIVASRGCGYGCHFCPVPATQGAPTRYRLAERVAAEMQLLHWRYGVRRFRFLDPLFGADRRQTLALCAAIIRRSLPGRVTWRCESRPEVLDLGLLQRLHTAGCRTLHLGVESVSPETLITIGRVPDACAARDYLTRVRQLVFGCRAFGIDCHIHVMAGLPGDRAGASATRAFLRAYEPDVVEVAPLVPYPGTTVFPTNRVDEELTHLRDAIEAPHADRPHVRWWRALSRAARFSAP